MEIAGKIIQVLDMQSGVGRNGTEWKKQDYVLETADQYPKKVCFNIWGDKIDQFAVQVGEDVTVSISVESREYNGRWYTDVRGLFVNKVAAQMGAPVDYAQPPVASAPFSSAPAPAQAAPIASSPVDDLPF